jgi:hypothetical protein
MGWYYCSWQRELNDLDQWDITVPHAVDQLVEWITDLCWCIVPEKRQHLTSYCKHKSKNSFFEWNKIWWNEWMLAFRRMAGTSRTFYELYFRFYCVVALRSDSNYVKKIGCENSYYHVCVAPTPAKTLKNWIQSTPSHPAYLRSISILSFHILLRVQSGVSP